jgi:mannose-1-phosphate guanylyltransferase
MVEQTIGRVARLIPPARTVTVLGPNQTRFLSRVQATGALGRVLEQPTDRGTGVAILWGLGHVVAQDPEATVMITPADHGIVSAVEYRDGIRVAARAVASGLERIVLFGTPPASPAQDYGWIVTGPCGDEAGRRLFRPVHRFAEKPDADDACRLMALGALWNTMVLVGRAAAVIDLFRVNYAHVVGDALGAASANQMARFETWPSIDFSREVLSGAPELSAYAWRPVLGWCDLGTEERLREWQQQESWAPATPTAVGRPDEAIFDSEIASVG